MVINDKPTMVTKDTSTLIDLVISSNRKNTRTIEHGIKDHMLVHASVQAKVKRALPPSKFHSCPRTFASRPTVIFRTIFQSWALSSDIQAAEMGLSYDPYGPARAFIAKLLRKFPYEGRTRWREQGRKKPSGPARIAYGSSRDAN